MPVVAAVDQSERGRSVVRRAKRLADDAGVELHVVHVGGSGLPSHQGGYDPDRTSRVSRQQARGIARQVGEEVLGEGEFTPVGLQGEPADEILTYAAEQDADYIVVSARKRTPVGQAVFGSVTQSLLLNAECPVVATPHEPE